LMSFSQRVGGCAHVVPWGFMYAKF
jgi:hypothetical protein